MSIKTWKEKFYPSAASVPKTMLGALEHALRKWKGLYPSVLKEHNLKIGENTEQEPELVGKDGTFSLGTDTCAVCVAVNVKCKICPLYKVRGKKCDAAPEWGIQSPYSALTVYGDPTYMIGLLHEAIELVKKEQ